MPYSSVKDLPEGTKKLSAHGKRAFKAAFNNAHKQYGGDESKAFAVAYSAAKKAQRKKRASQSAEGGEMSRAVTDAKAIYERYLQSHPEVPTETVDAVRGLFSEIEAAPEANLSKLKDLEQILVPSFDLVQHANDFPGSLDHQVRTVCCAVREQEKEFLGDWGYCLAVYPDYVVTCAEDNSYEGEPEYWKISYAMDAQGNVTFSGHEEVDVRTVVTPKTGGDEEGEQSKTADQIAAYKEQVEKRKTDVEQARGETDPIDQAAKMKTENGQSFGKGAYLIIPDDEKPSSWKVRVEESPGKVTVAQLGRAYAALTKGFRGNKVTAGQGEKDAALSKLRGLYKKAGAPFPGEKKEQSEEYPDWLLQGQDPPGGDEELVQTVAVQIQDKAVDPKDGVMHIKGVATVGNILSYKREVYPTAVWQDNVPRLQRLLEQGKLVGESDHPRDHIPTLDRTCVKYTSIWQDGNETWFEANILPTEPHGKNLITLIQNGVGVDISSRGMGKKVRGTWKNPDTGEVHQDVDVIQRGFRCDAFDPVVSGASPGSKITEYHMAQSSDVEAAEEELEMADVQELKQLIEGLAAQQKATNEIVLTLRQAKDEGITKVEAVKDEKPAETPAEKPADQSTPAHPLAGVTMTAPRDARTEKMLIKQAIEDLIAEANLPQQWANVYRRNLEGLTVKNVEELEQVAPSVLAILKTAYDDRPQYPGLGHQVQKDAGQRGPRSRRELIDALVADLPDDCPMDAMQKVFQDLDTGEEKSFQLPDSIRTPRRQLRQIITNIATHQDENWNGPAVFDSLLRMEQGYGARFVKEQWLDQACADGVTAIGAGGAPSSAIFIFPLVRRVFPQLIATELASVQPMDRPDGKIFYLDNYRISTGVDSVDEGGNTISNRMRMDRSDSFSSSYANDPGECSTPNRIQLRLSSKSITAQTKKLLAEASIEETQDLRAYHGLDAMTELISATSREVALEWNQIVLQELLDGATAGNRNFGTVAPSGYTQKEWDEYLVRMLEAASMDIFSKRYGTMTHIVAGPAATLKLSASYRVGIQPSGPNPEMFPGLTLNPWMAGASNNAKMYTTGFWTGVNTNKILVIRRGTDWSDTPYVWSPFIDYVTPILTLPSSLTQQQAIMSRAGHKVVVGDAIATITIQSGVTGVPL